MTCFKYLDFSCQIKGIGKPRLEKFKPSQKIFLITGFIFLACTLIFLPLAFIFFIVSYHVIKRRTLERSYLDDLSSFKTKLNELMLSFTDAAQLADSGKQILVECISYEFKGEEVQSFYYGPFEIIPLAFGYGKKCFRLKFNKHLDSTKFDSELVTKWNSDLNNQYWIDCLNYFSKDHLNESINLIYEVLNAKCNITLFEEEDITFVFEKVELVNHQICGIDVQFKVLEAMSSSEEG